METGLILKDSDLDKLKEDFYRVSKNWNVKQLNLIYVRGEYVLSAVLKQPEI